MFDSHVHSNFSRDSKIEIFDACEYAIKNNICGLSFSDHLDLDFPEREEFWWKSDFASRQNQLPALIAKYGKKLKIVQGIEVGLQKHVLQESQAIINQYQFDFVIASVHAVNNNDLTQAEYFVNKNKDEVFLSYLEAIFEMLELFHDFDVIGHIGFLRRYCPYEDKSMPYVKYREILDAILQKTISLNKGIEVNTSGYRLNLGPLPGIDIVRRFLELGGEIITLGSDAHITEHIGFGFAEAQKELKEIGVKHIAYFVERKPRFIRL